MRLLIDQNLPRSLARRLTEAGHDAIHTSTQGLDQASDPVVFAACVEHSRVLITGDKKLTKYLASTNAIAPSVVIVRGFGGPADEVFHSLIQNLSLVEDIMKDRGHAVFSIKADAPTRVQLLPLGAVTPG